MDCSNLTGPCTDMDQATAGVVEALHDIGQSTNQSERLEMYRGVLEDIVQRNHPGDMLALVKAGVFI